MEQQRLVLAGGRAGIEHAPEHHHQCVVAPVVSPAGAELSEPLGDASGVVGAQRGAVHLVRHLLLELFFGLGVGPDVSDLAEGDSFILYTLCTLWTLSMM